MELSIDTDKKVLKLKGPLPVKDLKKLMKFIERNEYQDYTIVNDQPDPVVIPVPYEQPARKRPWIERFEADKVYCHPPKNWEPDFDNLFRSISYSMPQ